MSQQARLGIVLGLNVALIAVSLGAHHGHTEIRAAVEGYVAVNGNVVLTERIDEMVYDGNKISARCMGAFEVRDDEITAWRDYFDVP